MLRELEKGEKVLVIRDSECVYKPGQLVTISGPANVKGLWNTEENEGDTLDRCETLAVSDKVVRGPDWDSHGGYGDWKPTCEGTVSHFEKSSQGNVALFGKWKPVVIWGDGQTRVHRMNADHQDLKPVGDSEPQEEGKPECFGKYPCEGRDCNDCPSSIKDEQGEHSKCKCQQDCEDRFKKGGCKRVTKQSKASVIYKHPSGDTITITIEEEVMTREQRAVKKDEERKSVQDEVKAAIEAHNDMLAQTSERMDALKDEAKVLRDFTTDKKYHIDIIKKAKNLKNKYSADVQAEAILACKGEGIEV